MTKDYTIKMQDSTGRVCDTWPFAVTKECGSLHAVKDWAAFYKDHPSPNIKSYVISAVAIASGQDENWI